MTSQSETPAEETKPKGLGVSLDAWAVVLALVAALLVRIGLIKQIPW